MEVPEYSVASTIPCPCSASKLAKVGEDPKRCRTKKTQLLDLEDAILTVIAGMHAGSRRYCLVLDIEEFALNTKLRGLCISCPSSDKLQGSVEDLNLGFLVLRDTCKRIRQLCDSARRRLEFYNDSACLSQLMHMHRWPNVSEITFSGCGRKEEDEEECLLNTAMAAVVGHKLPLTSLHVMSVPVDAWVLSKLIKGCSGTLQSLLLSKVSIQGEVSHYSGTSSVAAAMRQCSRLERFIGRYVQGRYGSWEDCFDASTSSSVRRLALTIDTDEDQDCELGRSLKGLVDLDLNLNFRPARLDLLLPTTLSRLKIDNFSTTRPLSPASITTFSGLQHLNKLEFTTMPVAILKVVASDCKSLVTLDITLKASSHSRSLARALGSLSQLQHLAVRVLGMQIPPKMELAILTGLGSLTKLRTLQIPGRPGWGSPDSSNPSWSMLFGLNSLVWTFSNFECLEVRLQPDEQDPGAVVDVMKVAAGRQLESRQRRAIVDLEGSTLKLCSVPVT